MSCRAQARAKTNTHRKNIGNNPIPGDRKEGSKNKLEVHMKTEQGKHTEKLTETNNRSSLLMDEMPNTT